MKTTPFFAITFMLLAQFAWAEEYTRSYEFKPIHIERNELLKAATEIFLYVKKINGEAVESKGYIKLGRDDYSTKLSFPLEQNDYEKFPRIAYDGILRIEAYHGVVSSIELWLFDIQRKITVTGTSHDHVTGLIKVVQEKLEPYESHYGGRNFRILLGIISFVLFTMAIFIAIMPNWARSKDRHHDIIYGSSFIIFNIVLNVLLYLPPWDKVFPGFLAGIENRSFLERNAAIFTFLGFVITILFPVSRFIIRLKKQNKTPNGIEADA
jgi:hypothetical protein